MEIKKGVISMQDRTPEVQAALDHFDTMVKLHGSVDAWIAHRQATEPDFVMITGSSNFGEQGSFISPVEADRQLAEARAKKLSRAI
jgi:hypothetical protein